MKTTISMKKITQKIFTSIGVLLIAFSMVSCFDDSSSNDPAAVILTAPVNSATNVAINDTITATFNKNMDHSTIVAANFTLKVTSSGTTVTGVVTYDSPNKRAVFAPSVLLTGSTNYTATITTGVNDVEGVALASNKVWTFTTAAAGLGPLPVILGSAGNYVILAKAGISTVPASVITGDIGLSPAAESFMTGFSQTKATGYSTCTQVTGFMYAADMTPPTPTYMTTAISNMQTAYTDAAGRINPNYLNILLNGEQTLAPGLHKWESNVSIGSDITISGGANDVWIFQISGNLSLANATRVTLANGAQAKNIFWQVAGTVTMGTTSHFEGIVLCQTAITMQTLSTMNGRLYAQTNVALDQATVTKP